MKNYQKINSILVVFILFLFACAPKDFTPFEKRIYTTTKTLEAAIEFRHLGLSITGNLYKKGLLPEKEKDKLIEIGDELYDIIITCQNALELYYNTGVEQRLEKKLELYTQIYGKFSDLVMPYILQHYEEE